MKNYLLAYSQGSIKDIEEAVDYYNKQQSGLGNKFIADIEKTLASIKRNPFHASVKYDNIRCAGLKKFPFAIHYSIEEDIKRTIIVAVFNTWKEPFW